MKRLLIAMLMLVCISCDKGENPVYSESFGPIFRESYKMRQWMEPASGTPELLGSTPVDIILVNDRLTVLFQTTQWVFIGDEVYCPDDYTITISKACPDGSYYSGIFYKGVSLQESYIEYVTPDYTFKLTGY